MATSPAPSTCRRPTRPSSAPEPAAARRPGRAAGWTTARIISVVAGALAGLMSLGLLGAGGTALWAQTQRHGAYVNLGTASYATSGYAIASDALQMHMAGGGWDGARLWSARSASRSPRLPTAARPSSGSPRRQRRSTICPGCRTRPSAASRTITGPTPSTPGPRPRQAGRGWHLGRPGNRTRHADLTWKVRSGDWMVVVMNADGSRPVTVQASAAATLPALPWIAAGLLIGGLAVLAAGVVLIAVPVRNASRARSS